MTSNQLFRLVRDFSFPEPIEQNSSTGEYLTCLTTMPAAMAICWPDGRPCCLAEMYLLERWPECTSRRLDGGSLKVFAAQLSLLLRFAFNSKVNLWDFDDLRMKTAISWLQRERSSRNPAEHRRDDNTTRRIVATWVSFFQWLQVQLCCEKPIVGTSDVNPRILLKLKKSIGRHGKVVMSLEYRYSPEPVTHEDARGPIARELKLRLWEAVNKMASRTLAKQGLRLSDKLHTEEMIVTEYLRKRREALLALLEATGARPGELARVSVEKNRAALKKAKLLMCTLKRRKSIDPERIVPIDRAVAMRIEVFIYKYRAPLIEMLEKKGRRVDTGDCMFLTVEGKPLTESTLEKEFPRIVQAAGLQDERACMSMFRHRFITNMVKLHLMEFMSANPLKNGRRFITDSDYRTILKRVAVFTGHGDEQSLLDYIDLAWEEMGIFDYVEPARVLASAVESGLNRVSGLLATIQSGVDLSRLDIRMRVVDELCHIRSVTLEALAQDRSACATGALA
ncbi:phage integrase family protein [Paraburkholderia xenovorans LB400]|uniref:Tyr recombinase domain-containing protein n=1 Tax=Paraburkholderia xenovorans (strain LB400) TaxID=266265 RepID=Q143L7_PARXL|nr:tyrosine-type recombinase/integrase [Paraburkholderia xenovorans]ABE29472.1 Hypothetical protein Bxe_A3513 [Paraburkholderia xenovorans LB400]AIP30191.1 phage integrase family protein [Paraburkholderia xenovorans LB400]